MYFAINSHRYHELPRASLCETTSLALAKMGTALTTIRELTDADIKDYIVCFDKYMLEFVTEAVEPVPDVLQLLRLGLPVFVLPIQRVDLICVQVALGLKKKTTHAPR